MNDRGFAQMYSKVRAVLKLLISPARQCSCSECLWTPNPVKCGGTGLSAARFSRQDLLCPSSQAGVGVTLPSCLCWCSRSSLQQHHVLDSKTQPLTPPNVVLLSEVKPHLDISSWNWVWRWKGPFWPQGQDQVLVPPAGPCSYPCLPFAQAHPWAERNPCTLQDGTEEPWAHWASDVLEANQNQNNKSNSCITFPSLLAIA